jgi:glutathione S-transferase
MALTLYAHPFSSYCQKVLIALYENAIPFGVRLVNFGDPESVREFAGVWPMKRMPVLVDDGRPVMESSVIIEHLGVSHPGPVRLLPADSHAALDVRFMDRFFDNYVMTPMGRIVFDRMRAPDAHDPQSVAEARALLDAAYGWLEARMAGRAWAAGDFSLADCAAAPSLFYADWVHPIGESFPNTRAYRKRLLARPSFARAVDEARQYRGLFPGGAPDRD